MLEHTHILGHNLLSHIYIISFYILNLIIKVYQIYFWKCKFSETIIFGKYMF